MKNTYQRVPTRFARAIRFQLKPTPLTATRSSDLEKLKERLLGELVQAAPGPEQEALFRRAANEAAALVWLTPFPLLLFPTLLEEKAQDALRQSQHQARVLQRSANLLRDAA